MAQTSLIKRHIVWSVNASYDDLELNTHVETVEVFIDFASVLDYLRSLDKETEILDNAMYQCRSNLKFKISQKFISDRNYVSLFKTKKS